ncbi:type II secretion system protein N [Blastomonas sp.]|uniref:type II secretion system protein N n=1 Tax=Blastomonas sp. TaxID=1909299 RepID=UPI002621C017|nr:type II secretion system protein N [Blastomonas sp.]MDM7956890.1 type II secretion system protein N [Blastomonas sp.]
MASAAHNGAQTGLGASLSRFRSARFEGRGGSVARFLPVGLYGWLRALLVLALVIQLARLIWTIVTPISPLGDWQARTANVMSAPSRAALFASFDGFDRAAATGDASAAVTSLDLTLYGLRMNEASGGGSAIIAGSDGVQRSYSVGEEVASGVKLVEVLFDHVVLERGGSRESLFIDQSVPAETVGDTAAAPVSGAPQLPVAQAGPLTSDAITAGIGFAPRSENGRVSGFAVTPKADGAVFAQAGFKPGDIVVEINGRKVSSAQDGAALAGQLRPGARISLLVERGTETLPIALIIPEP